jgi:hypothetical protein
MSQVVHKASLLYSALHALKYVPNFKHTDLQLVVRVARWYIFIPKIPILGKFLMALEWKMLVYFMHIWNILRAFGICYGHLVILWQFCIYFPHFGILCQEKSGNPACCRFLQINFLRVSFLQRKPLILQQRNICLVHAGKQCSNSSGYDVQGCQMVHFHTRTTKLGIVGKAF